MKDTHRFLCLVFLDVLIGAFFGDVVLSMKFVFL